MERLIRPFDAYREEEKMFADPPSVDAGRILATAEEQRNRTRAHHLWVFSFLVSWAVVYMAVVSPTSSSHLMAQSQQAVVTDGRMVRQEEKLENMLAIVATHTTDIKLQGAEIIRLTSELEGAEKTIKFGGALVLLFNGLAVWFSRKK